SILPSVQYEGPRLAQSNPDGFGGTAVREAPAATLAVRAPIAASGAPARPASPARSAAAGRVIAEPPSPGADGLVIAKPQAFVPAGDAGRAVEVASSMTTEEHVVFSE